MRTATNRTLRMSIAALLASSMLPICAQAVCPNPLPAGMQCPAPDHLDKIDSDYSGPGDGIYNYFFTGAGVDVYIVDDGVDPHIGELPNLQPVGFDAFPGSPVQTHAQRVAMIVGGVVGGVAKDVRLYSVKVTSPGLGRDVPSGLAWAIAHNGSLKTPRRAVINISMDYRLLMAEAATRQKIEEAIAQGIVVVIASGNNIGLGAPVTNTCAGLPDIPLLYVVGNADPGSMGIGSRGGPCVDGYAPNAFTVGGGFTLSSASAPQFSGIAALVLEQFPNLSVAGVHAELNKRATKGKIHPPGNTGQWIPGSWDRLAQSLPVYFSAPTAMTSINFENMLCHNEYAVSWSGGGGDQTYYELQSSLTPSFATYETQVTEDTALSVFPAVNTYYRVRACNGYGCGAYATRSTPVTPYPGCS